MFPYPLARADSCLFYLYTYAREALRDKKPAKVQLFPDMTKFFCKKIQKKCILHGLLGIFGLNMLAHVQKKAYLCTRFQNYMNLCTDY